MTTHANCSHSNTKSARAACRRGGHTTATITRPRAQAPTVEVDADMLDEMRNYRTPQFIRTDIHRPAAFDPEAYDFSHAGTYNSDPMFADIRREAARMLRLAMDDGYTFAPHQHSGQCGHCGSRLTNYAVMLHPATKEMILIGETCLNGRFEMATHAFQSWRKMRVGLNARKAKAARIENILKNHPELEGLRPYAVSDINDSSFLTSMAYALFDTGKLTEKQIEAAKAALIREAERKAKRDAEAEALKHLPPLEAGKRTITGVVIFTRWADSAFGYGSSGSLKGLIRDADGYKFWGTLPRGWDGEKGDDITITATIQPKADDPHFAFYKRPRLA